MSRAGAEIKSVLLHDGELKVRLLSVGCAVQSWHVAGLPVVLGYADPDDYRANPYTMGMVIGRVVNRISGACFELNGETFPLSANLPPTHIHGGPGGLGWRNWETEVLDEKSVRFRFLSPHLDQGYPGEVHFEVVMRLSGYELSYEMTAVPDRITPINMAQHQYFNLMGDGDIRDHSLRIGASRDTPTDSQAFPLGSIESVENTVFDFRQARIIKNSDPEQLGHDASLVIDKVDRKSPAAEAWAPNGIKLQLGTDQPCLQLYTSGTLEQVGSPGSGAAHQRFAGFCLEAQNYPDALSHSHFPSILHGPDTPYTQSLRLAISPQ